MKLINLLSVSTSFINLILNIILGTYFGIFGIATASSTAFLIGNILQIIFIKRFIKAYQFRNVIKKITSPFLVGALTFLLMYFFKENIVNYKPQYNLLIKILYLSLNFIIYSVIYFSFSFFLKVEVVTTLGTKVIKRVKGKLI